MKKIYALLAIIVAFHSFILTKLIFFPYPELFVYPFLAENGLLPYSQIFDQHFPSFLMLPVNISDFGLTTPSSARVFLIILVGLSQVLLFLVARRFLKKEKYALLVNICYLVLQPLFEGYIFWIDTFLVPVLLFSAYFLLKFFDEKKIIFLVLSGLALGGGVFLKQSVLPVFLLVGLSVYLARESIKDLAVFLGIGAIPTVLLLLWVYQKAIFPEFFYWTVRFNFEVYGQMARKFPTPSQLARLGVYLLPAIFLFVMKFRKDVKILTLSLFLFASILPVFSRFEFVHLQPALPFMVLFLVVFLLTTHTRIVVPVFLVILLATALWLPGFYRGHLGSSVYFFDPDTVASAKIVKSLTGPSDPIFVFGPQPVIYPLADRLPSGKVFTVTVPWNMYAAGDKILQSIKSDPPKIVLRDSAAEIDGKKVVDFANDLEDYITTNYVKTGQVGGNEILIQKK
jgi:hypothetical protein